MLSAFKHLNWINTGITCLVLICAALLLSAQTVDADIWGHIQYGEDWLQTGELATTATHTYADPNYHWVNHENLAELVMAIVQRLSGGYGLMICKALIGILILLAMRASSVRKGVHDVFASIMLLPVAYGMSGFWYARPQIASFACFALLLMIFNAVRDEQSQVESQDALPKNFGWKIWLVVPLMILWTNSHGGFVAGLCLIFAWLGLKVIFSVMKHGLLPCRSLITQSIAIAITTLGSTLINPYGLELPLWLWNSLGTSRPEISEWASLLTDSTYLLPWLVMSGTAAWAWLKTDRKRDWVRIIIFTLIAAQSFVHIRHLVFMALLYGFWVPADLQSALGRDKAPAANDQMSGRSRFIVGGQIAFAILLMLGTLVYQISNFGVSRHEYPVSAIEFMDQHDLNGRLVATFDWAQYAIAALPKSQVGFDGRFRTCYSQEVIDMHFDFITGRETEYRNRDEANSGPYDPEKVLRFKNPELVLIKSRFPAATGVMESQADWTLLYKDGTAQVWGRSAIYDDPESQRYLPPSLRKVSSDVQTGIAAWPAVPRSTDSAPYFTVLSH